MNICMARQWIRSGSWFELKLIRYGGKKSCYLFSFPHPYLCKQEREGDLGIWMNSQVEETGQLLFVVALVKGILKWHPWTFVCSVPCAGLPGSSFDSEAVISRCTSRVVVAAEVAVVACAGSCPHVVLAWGYVVNTDNGEALCFLRCVSCHSPCPLPSPSPPGFLIQIIAWDVCRWTAVEVIGARKGNFYFWLDMNSLRESWAGTSSALPSAPYVFLNNLSPLLPVLIFRLRSNQASGCFLYCIDLVNL